MSTFSFDALSGAILEPMAIDDTTNLDQYLGQSWTDTEFGDSPDTYSYASSNSSFSCGSLTSGYLTPQSSISASTSRRQSLVSVNKPVTSFGTSVVRSTRSRTPRTPTKYVPYASRGLGIHNLYSGSAPVPQSPLDTIAMASGGNNLSGKLNWALGFGSTGCPESSLYSEYDKTELISPHASLIYEQGLQSARPIDNQNSNYLTHNSPYEDLPNLYTWNSVSEPQQPELPETIAPSQTTYKSESTPPPRLAEPFVTPSKSSFSTSPVEGSPSFLDRAQSFAYHEETSTSPATLISSGSGGSYLSSSSDSDDEAFLCKSEAPGAATVLKAPSIFPKTKAPRRTKVAKRSPISTGYDELIKKPQHRCPHCVERRCFKRPEHLNRHVESKHKLGERKDIPCQVPGCETVIVYRTDNMKAHYTKTHMYGNEKKKGKKNIWISVEDARHLGLSWCDPRIPPEERIKKEFREEYKEEKKELKVKREDL